MKGNLGDPDFSARAAVLNLTGPWSLEARCLDIFLEKGIQSFHYFLGGSGHPPALQKERVQNQLSRCVDPQRDSLIVVEWSQMKPFRHSEGLTS